MRHACDTHKAKVLVALEVCSDPMVAAAYVVEDWLAALLVISSTPWGTGSTSRGPESEGQCGTADISLGSIAHSLEQQCWRARVV